MVGRSIKIFLVDGIPSGVRTAELGMSTIKALVTPRASLSAVTKRDEVQRTGVYVLVGPDQDKPGQKKAYIGEGDSVLTRLVIHNKDSSKDFWEEAVVFVSKDQNLTKSHARYLEARLIALAQAAKRSTVENGTSPEESGWLPESDVAEMEDFISQARLLLGALGYDLFEPTAPLPAPVLQNQNDGLLSPEFTYSGGGFSATCSVNLDAAQFIVLKGSKARRQEAPALSSVYRNLRSQLINSAVLKDFDDQSFQFDQDYSFSSVTAAAQVVSGTSVNGRTAWKTKIREVEKTYAQWQDELLASDSNAEPQSPSVETENSDR